MRFGLAVAAVLAAISPNSMAQSPAGSFRLGSAYVYPEIEFALQRDSNIALQPEAKRIGDTIRYVRPSFRLDAKGDAQNYDAGYRGEYARYGNVTTDNHENHEVFSTGDWTLNTRNNFKLKGQYLDRVDPRGALDISTPSPNEYHQEILTGLYTYGAQDAAGKFELQAGGYSKNYVNNRLQTAVLDHSRTELGATLMLRIQPKTYATLAARQYRYKYAEAGSAKDSQEIFAFAGLRWNITALTAGRINIGQQTKKPDSAAGAAGSTEFSGIAWEGGLNWRPLSYSSFDFVTQKRAVEPTGIGDFVLNQTHQIVWTHVWGSRVTTVLSAGYSKDSYFGASSGNRQDENWTGGVRVLYAVQRWLKFGAEYASSIRDSNNDSFDYQRNQSMLLVNVTL